MAKVALVYAGEGAGQRSVASATESLIDALNIQVRAIDTAELLRGSWQDDCAVLCMPGGADLPYCQDLNGHGNKLIREYVKSGGSYLGLCAGAYYACNHIEFELGTPLEVRGKRELSFYPGLAKGAVIPGFTYSTEAGTEATPISFQSQNPSEGKKRCRDYSNGGPAFTCSGEHQQTVTELAWYVDSIKGAAAVKCQIGAGTAVLCGTHPELNPRWLDKACDAKALKEAHPEYSAIKIAQLIDRAKEVRLCLREDDSQRRKFWMMLLSQAGLNKHLNP